MQIKEVKPINFLFYRAETRVTELERFIPIGQELFAEALKNNLKITGPVHWHYFGFDGDANKTFTLEVSLPVSHVLDEYDGKFHFKRTENFRCVSTTHEGGWLDIPSAYGKLFQYISENKLQPIAANREIYVNVDFHDPDANSTEIQIGIK